MLPGHLQYIEGSRRVDVKVIEWSPGRQIVTGLGGTMHDKIKWSLIFEKPRETFTITDIKLIMLKMARALTQPLKIPCGVPLRTEKIRTHIIVNSEDTVGTAVKKAHEFRPDEATRSGNEDFHNELSLLMFIRAFSWTWQK
jgi:hypothetical protein